MSPLLVALINALIEVEIKLLPMEIELISAGFAAIIKRFESSSTKTSALSDNVTKIVLGLAQKHPDWPGDQKREYARNAIAQYQTNLNQEPDMVDIDNRIQLEVSRLGLA